MPDPVPAPGGEALRVEGLSRTFRTRDSSVTALDGVDLAVERGQSLAVVGESGSGKTTLGRVVARLERADSGRVILDGSQEALSLRGRELREYRRKVQIIFQNSSLAFNPRRRVVDLLTDGYAIHGTVRRAERRDHAAAALQTVGLPTTLLNRYPRECSGGQRQRVGIARALSIEPSVLIADEPVSGLDMSVQAQVLNLLARLKRERSLTLMFITHDMRAAYFLCERIAVFYLGRIVELGPRESILGAPRHPYTRGLVGSIAHFRTGDSARPATMRGEIETSDAKTRGCPFQPRCPLWRELGQPEICLTERPELAPVAQSSSACHFSDESVAAS